MKLNDALFFLWQVQSGELERDPSVEKSLDSAAAVILGSLEKAAHGIVRNKELREDLCNEVFLKLLERMNGPSPLPDNLYESEKAAFSYLCRSLRNLSIDTGNRDNKMPLTDLEIDPGAGFSIRKGASPTLETAELTLELRYEWKIFRIFASFTFAQSRKDAQIRLQESFEQLVDLATEKVCFSDIVKKKGLSEDALYQRHSRTYGALNRGIDNFEFFREEQAKQGTHLSSEDKSNIEKWIRWLRRYQRSSDL